jgi:hypothetical protein
LQFHAKYFIPAPAEVNKYFRIPAFAGMTVADTPAVRGWASMTNLSGVCGRPKDAPNKFAGGRKTRRTSSPDNEESDDFPRTRTPEHGAWNRFLTLKIFFPPP